jgi:hypothetical protein
MVGGASGRVILSFIPRRSEDAEELSQELLKPGGAEAVHIEASSDLSFAAEAVLAILILGTTGLAVIARIADWLRDRGDCLLVIDARGEDLKIEERCDIVGRRGQVIVVTSPNEQVVIHRSEAFLDLQAIVNRAIEKSASAVAEFASSAGARVEIESPRTHL